MGIFALCYIYIYMKLMQCNGFPEIYAWLEEGVGSICHGYMCILLYMKLIWYNGFPEIFASRYAKFGVAVFKASMLYWPGGGGRPWVYLHCAIYIYIWNLCSVMVFQRSMLDWRRGWGQSAMGIYAFCYIWNLFGIMVFQRSLPVDMLSLV